MTNMLTSHSNNITKDVASLSEQETKQFLTPFAFKMDESLFGLPLASPTKRGIALLIDLALVALLSDTPGVVLALTIAVTLYYLGNKKRAQEQGRKKGRKRRAMMRFIAALMVFIVLVDTLPPLFKSLGIEDTQPQVDENELSLTQSLALGAIAISTIKTISESDCQQLDCWQSQLGPVAANMATISYEGKIKVSQNQLDNVFADIAKEVALLPNEQAQLISFMQSSFDMELAKLAGDADEIKPQDSSKNADTQTTSTQGIEDKEAILVLGDDSKLTDIEKQKEKSKEPVYSIIEWVKGIIEDLGLGFGWATFYFTVLIALGKGQTIGKKLLGIKVLQLDGTPLSLWHSFERYGGYGAGLATGLLGFIQIYWDPNKQAIHDRISATVVIDIKKARLNQKEHGNEE